MSPDGYLNYAALFVSYFVKVAAAYLLCWLLAKLAATPRQKFIIWLAFMLGSIAYWTCAVAAPLTTYSTTSGQSQAGSLLPKLEHQFLVPARFEHATLILGRSLLAAYIVGVLLLVGMGVWKRIRLHFLLKQGVAPSSELNLLFAEMCRHFGIRHCELLVLPKVSSPATVCWWRPRVVLPQACEGLDDSSLMADILYHELAHVARRDYLWSSMNDLICRLLFFHPGVWQARKEMSIHREMACDLAVVAARPEHRADYAHTLTRVARLCLLQKYPIIGIDFAAVPSLLTHRVHAILNDPEKSSWVKKCLRALAGFSLIGGYAALCSAVAIAMAFVPTPQPVQKAPILAARKPLAHSAPRHKTVTVQEADPHPDEEGLITESPAYRIMTTDGGASAELPADAANGSNLGFADSNNGHGWVPAGAGQSTRSAGRTVESIVVATVGTVIGADKDDRSKRKDSSHLQKPSR